MKSQVVNNSLILLLPSLLVSLTMWSAPSIEKVEPPYWWTGMEYDRLELMIYGDELSGSEVAVDYDGIRVLNVTSVTNDHYLFIELGISPETKPGTFNLTLRQGRKKTEYKYQLKSKDDMPNGMKGLNQSDFIYLLYPDRFANGDYSNDILENSYDTELNREHIFRRHGGDLQGVIDHLDYIEDLGVTALWLNPVWTNDRPETSYHGYAPTDIYEIDPRLGGNQSYMNLADSCRQRGIKVIKDIVYNHWSDKHWIYQDLPDSSWINFWPEYTNTTYRAPTLLDPYADPAETKVFSDGWFTTYMPDLNQRNPHLSNYLIQNSIWWIGTYGIDAFRIDTYAYPDQLFMAELAERIESEFPDFMMFGETWVHGHGVQAWFTEDNHTQRKFDSGLDGVTDFQLYYAINDCFNEGFGWTQGASKLYYALAHDVLYDDPKEQVTFLDNHDLSRVFAVMGEDPAKLKMAIGFMMTTRGIPSLYYGTEIALSNFADPDGKVRQDFPGGWKEDESNKFEASGRNELETDVFEFTQKLANYRKNHPEIFTGRLTQFVPQDGVYAYVRHNEGEKFLVILNPTEEERSIDLSNMSTTQGMTQGFDIITEQVVDLESLVISTPAKTIQMIEVR
ncbi:alpha-amylase family glycosyl hydrolase [Sanyastnella coralliicola]|uniref:alpha-amylase family glycosyl hydrolase n=1 Tax=Sanyastnella coralliicola TaxID=3069118 RepID=UPI0027B93175|nr:alpha-amylase family glycosyl hydrolase [Longitalea sp. SCSIO 12813]